MPDGETVLPPCHGLVWAWHPDGAGPLGEAAVEDCLRRFPDGGGLWLHFDLVDVRAQAFLQALPALPGFARDALLERAETPHLEVTGEVLWGAVPDFHQDAEGEPDPVRMSLMTMVLTPRLLVTARRHPLRASHLCGGRAMPGTPPAGRWGAILKAVLEGLGRSGAALAARLNVVEEALLRGDDSGRAELAALRRTALLLHRRIEPLAQAYADLAEDPPAWLAAAGHDPVPMARRLEAALRAAQAVQERGRIAQDELASLTAEEANRRLLVLSVLTAVLLPPSLVAGIFGMNTTDLPGTHSPGGFWWALLTIIASGVLALLVMTRLRVLRGAGGGR